jgi:hypothetical protein
MKNCTISGMLRKTATYAAPAPAAHRFGSVRNTPKKDPAMKASTHAQSDTVIVTQKPEISQPRYVVGSPVDTGLNRMPQFQ